MVLGLVVASNAYADIEKIYAQSCATCHDSGTFNAPKKGDVAIWHRLNQQKGQEALIKSMPLYLYPTVFWSFYRWSPHSNCRSTDPQLMFHCHLSNTKSLKT